MATFNYQQRTFTMSSMANLDGSVLNYTAAELQTRMAGLLDTAFADTTTIIPAIGQWQRVWGPVVVHVDGDTTGAGVSATNTMYVAKNMNPLVVEYVVAIAGTNPISKYGWLKEDFDVSTMSNLLAPGVSLPGNAKISTGTQTGITILQDMKDPKTGDSLFTFLQNEFSKLIIPAGLTFTGHSLGGALSPTMALYFSETKSTWDPKSKAIMTVLPTAGATPGNTAFAAYYETKLGITTTRLWNQLDIVPHAWEVDLLAKIPGLYNALPYPNGGPLVTAFMLYAEEQSLKGAGLLAKGGPYLQLNRWAHPMPGTLNTTMPQISLYTTISLIVELLLDELLSKLPIPPAVRTQIESLLKTLLADLGQGATDADVIAWFQQQEAKDPAIAPVLAGLLKLFIMIQQLLNFLQQAAYQHTTQYALLIDTSSVSPYLAALKKEFFPPDTTVAFTDTPDIHDIVQSPLFKTILTRITPQFLLTNNALFTK